MKQKLLIVDDEPGIVDMMILQKLYYIWRLFGRHLK